MAKIEELMMSEQKAQYKVAIAVGFLLALLGTTDAIAQWATYVIHIYNTNDGNVGIGTITPQQKLHVIGNTQIDGHVGIGTAPNFQLHINGPNGIVFNKGTTASAYGAYAAENDAPGHSVFVLAGGTTATGTQFSINLADSGQIYTNNMPLAIGPYGPYNLTLGTNNAARMTVTSTGNVGIGTTAPGALLSVGAAGNSAYTAFVGGVTGRLGIESTTVTNAAFVDFTNAGGTSYIGSENSSGNALFGTGGLPHALALVAPGTTRPIQFGTAGAARLTIDSSGNVGIGTTTPAARVHVVGDGTFTGTVSGANVIAKYQDVAEWVPASQQLSPGTVVILDAETSNQVVASTEPYDTTVAGVISAKPGVLLGEAGEGKVKVATTGRVKVKVDATSLPIRIGDLLVTSSKPGLAMRSDPILVAGTKIHRPGTLIGKALESLDSGTGEILVLLSPPMTNLSRSCCKSTTGGPNKPSGFLHDR